MADQGVAPDEQQLKKRAMRRLAMALTLIALAIAGLAVLDRYNASLRKSEIPSSPLEPRALPGEPAMEGLVPAPAPSKPAQSRPPSKPAQQPPPPPPVVSNEALPAAEPARPALKAAAELPEETEAPAKRGPAAVPPEKAAQGKAVGPKETAAPRLAKAAEPQAPNGFAVQVGVFSTTENVRALQAKLSEKGIRFHTETRVVVGPFKDRAEADAVTKQLKELGLQGVVVAPHGAAH
jgi:DedD protein